MKDNTALLVIDVQKGFDEPHWGKRNNLDAESNISKLIDAWRSKQQPIIHIQHCSADPDSPLHPKQAGNAFKKEALPVAGEKIFTKSVNSAFIGTTLEQYLHENTITDLVIVGLTTDHCVSTTTRMAANLGFNVILISDATATFDREDHEGKHYSGDSIHMAHLASLRGEFCQVISTDKFLQQVFKKRNIP